MKNINLDIKDGEFVVLVGPSGCGKTTTLRMIAGFEDPTAGEIRIDGRVVNDLEPRDRGLGMVFQSHALFPHKTVAQNIEFGLRMKKVPAEERAKRVREVAEMVRITHLLDKMPRQCSGGESQRVALARTLVTNPSTFLLDEPLSSLDAKLRRELRAECDRLHEELKRTFIYVTHDQEEAMTLADRIVVMRDGRDRADRLADGDLLQSGQLFRRRLLRLAVDEPGRAARSCASGARARFRSARFEIALPERFKDCASPAATLGIRPEHVGVALGGRRRRSSFRCGWSSRSARTRCSISTTAPSAPSWRSAKASDMAEIKRRRARHALLATRAASTCSTPTDRRIGAPQ